jgi:hypothetical protein
MLNNPLDEIKKRESIEVETDLENEIKPLFNKSRILFLIVVFFVVSLPLIYRYFSYLL